MRRAMVLVVGAVLGACSAFQSEGEDAGARPGATPTVAATFEANAVTCAGVITPAGASGTPTSSGHESARSCLVCATNQATKGITPYLELDADGALEPGTYPLGFYARNPPSGPTPGTVRAQLRGYAGGALKWYRETTPKPLSAAFGRRSSSSASRNARTSSRPSSIRARRRASASTSTT